MPPSETTVISWLPPRVSILWTPLWCSRRSLAACGASLYPRALAGSVRTNHGSPPALEDQGVQAGLADTEHVSVAGGGPYTVDAPLVLI